MHVYCHISQNLLVYCPFVKCQVKKSINAMGHEMCVNRLQDKKEIMCFLCAIWSILELKRMQQRAFGKFWRRPCNFPQMLFSCYLIHFQIVQFWPLNFSPTSFQEMFEPKGQFWRCLSSKLTNWTCFEGEQGWQTQQRSYFSPIMIYPLMHRQMVMISSSSTHGFF